MPLRRPLALLVLVCLAGCQLAAGVSPLAAHSGSLAARGVIPAGYYDKVQGLSGQPLLRGLHDLVAKHQDLGYDQARDLLFGKVDDPDNNNTVLGVYTGKIGQGVSDRFTADKKGMNTEHTWPQSKGAQGVARDDLHHLFPADIEANGKRSSFPFGEVQQVVWQAPDQGGTGQTSRLGYDASGAMVWEPRPVEKGNVARALLYFYTCYAVHGTTSVSLDNFQHELPLLLKWHTADQVSAAEANRNDVVYGLQGNRNPYIDHPEFVAQVGDFLGQ